jgi:elongation factor G
MGELHLEIVVDKLRNDHGVGVNTGKPRVSYRETVTKTGHADYKYVRQSGGRGQYGHVVMSIEPGTRGSGLTFQSSIIGGSIPKEFIPAIEKGVKGAMERGVVAGFPMVDVEVTVIDGSYHAVDSSANSFEIAGSLAFQQAAKDAAPLILEPIMAVEVVTPEQFMGDAIGTISARSGQIRNTISRGNAKIIEAHMPLRNLFGYTMELRSKTQGRAIPSVRFSHYETCTLKASDLKK